MPKDWGPMKGKLAKFGKLSLGADIPDDATEPICDKMLQIMRPVIPKAPNGTIAPLPLGRPKEPVEVELPESRPG